jgi:predicted ATP-grasp superfamily ATP-dependent carboligase
MGGRNALSVVRSLGRMGVPVHVLGSRWSVRVAASRYARKLPFPRGEGPWKERMLEFLLGPASLPVRGAVLLACNDPPIELLAEHREALLPHYRLDACHPPAQLAMLDKLATYRAAAAADVPTPRFWEAAGEEDLEALRGDLRYPLIVKPTSSAAFQSAFGGKHFRVSSFDEARRAVRSMREAGLAEPALRLVRHVGLRGIANVEFKIDPRDGVPKLIECNARFTTSNGLLEASGLDLARWVYRRAVGIPQEAPGPFRLGVRMRDPGGDFAAYRHLARRGELDFAGWLRTLRPSRPFWFRWDDPMPSVAYGVHRALRAARRGLRVGRDLPRRSGVIPGPSAARGRGEPTPHDDPGPA